MKVEDWFYPKEIGELAITVLVIAFVFSYVYNSKNLLYTALTYPAFLFVAIFSFAAHELAHKYAGRKFNCAAYYEMNLLHLVFSVIASVATGFVILVPGHVVIKPFRFGRWGHRLPHLSITEMGVIAYVGPLTNLALGLFFRLFPGNIFYILSFINAWLAFFNLIPAKPLDGSKIFAWKQSLWMISILIAFFLMVTFVLS